MFGDADRLPTTNVLGCGWPYAPQDVTTFDAEIIEVVKDTGDIAWSTKIYGNSKRLAEAEGELLSAKLQGLRDTAIQPTPHYECCHSSLVYMTHAFVHNITRIIPSSFRHP